jgi:O-antigen/teichoic acid export membrane protein
VTGRGGADTVWGGDHGVATIARNVSTRYLAIGTDAAIGLVLLPFNVHHLGQSAWGLWMLTASITAYFSILDLGYGGSITRFVAQYRARRDADGLNDLLSTMAVLFAGVGLVAYAAFAIVAANLGSLFNLAPDQVATGRSLMLMIGLYVSLGFPFGIFGGVMNGFQRYDLNNVVAITTSVAVALVNVAMLLAGASLVALVAATTGIRIAAYFVYRLNAYRVFPALSLRPSRFRWARLREVTGFSVYVLVIDWSNRLNYSIDAVLIGIFLTPAAVALWTVPQRLSELLQRFTNQLNGVLFPMVVDSDTAARTDRLRTIFVHGTRLSLVTVVPLATGLALLAGPLMHAWVGPAFAEGVVVAQILAVATAIRVGNATGTTVLKGAGRHRFLATANAVAAMANVSLSLLWIGPYGLAGVATATLVAVSTMAVLVLWPAACQRVGIGIGDAFARAVWPALWPAIAMAAAVVLVRDSLPATLPSVAAASAIGGAVYLGTFLAFGVTSDDRRTYLTKAGEMARLRRLPAAA